MTRRYDRAIAQEEDALKIQENFAQAHRFKGQAYLKQGNYRQAILELESGVALSSGGSVQRGLLGNAYALGGNRLEAQKILADLLEEPEQAVAPYYIAIIYLGLNDKEKALEWLNKA